MHLFYEFRFDENIQAQLNAIYGADVSTAQEALLLLRTVSAIGGASAVGKTGGKVTGKVAEAVSKKLDEILSEAAEKALIKSGGIVGADGKPVLDLKQLTNGAKGIPNSTLTRDELISGLPAGTKITPESVVDIRKLPDGRTVWLETGSDAAGLQHIYKRHEVDFVNKGVLRDEIPTVVMSALERGKIVGTNGSANVYRITHNGVEQNIAIGVGSNGFVVRANPVSSWKPLP